MLRREPWSWAIFLTMLAVPGLGIASRLDIPLLRSRHANVWFYVLLVACFWVTYLSARFIFYNPRWRRFDRLP
jgi:hypothetical protein